MTLAITPTEVVLKPSSSLVFGGGDPWGDVYYHSPGLGWIDDTVDVAVSVATKNDLKAGRISSLSDTTSQWFSGYGFIDSAQALHRFGYVPESVLVRCNGLDRADGLQLSTNLAFVGFDLPSPKLMDAFPAPSPSEIFGEREVSWGLSELDPDLLPPSVMYASASPFITTHQGDNTVSPGDDVLVDTVHLVLKSYPRQRVLG